MTTLKEWLDHRRDLVMKRQVFRERAFPLIVPAIESWLKEVPRDGSDPITGKRLYSYHVEAPYREASSARLLLSISVISFNGHSLVIKSPDEIVGLHILLDDGVPILITDAIEQASTVGSITALRKQTSATSTRDEPLTTFLNDFESKVIGAKSSGVRIG